MRRSARGEASGGAETETEILVAIGLGLGLGLGLVLDGHGPRYRAPIPSARTDVLTQPCAGRAFGPPSTHRGGATRKRVPRHFVGTPRPPCPRVRGRWTEFDGPRGFRGGRGRPSSLPARTGAMDRDRSALPVRVGWLDGMRWASRHPRRRDPQAGTPPLRGYPAATLPGHSLAGRLNAKRLARVLVPRYFARFRR